MTMEKQWITEPGDWTKAGVTKNGQGVNFTLELPEEETAELLLFQKGAPEPEAVIPMGEKVMGDLCSVFLKGFRPERYEYVYRVKEEVFVDPRAERVLGRKHFGEWDPETGSPVLRGGFSFDRYDWGNDRHPGLPYEEGILYHLHVRGFTKNPDSKVRHKGTFMGVAEKIPYLKELGVNQLLLMPIYDFDERILPEKEKNLPYQKNGQEAKRNYWGYGKSRYFAPKSTYAVKDPVKECKDLVKALHAEGIEVLMEVYFPEGTQERLIFDCLKHWVREYHVDGFYLMGDASMNRFLARDPMFAGTKLLSSWFDTENIYGRKKTPAFRNLAEHNDGFLVNARRFLKGDEDQLPAFIRRVRKNSDRCAVINYITHHDGFTLMDLVSYEERHNEANGEGGQDGPAYNFSWNCGVEGPSRKKKVQELRLQQMKNAFLLLLFSQGTPMILAGDEFGNSQRGNNNPYCQDNEISWLEWNGLKKQAELFAFVKTAIAFRKSHPLLHQARELQGTSGSSLGYPDVSCHGRQAWYENFEAASRHFGMMYCGQEAKEGKYLYVAYNLHWNEQDFALPRLPDGLSWQLVFDTEDGIPSPEKEIRWIDQKSFEVPPRSILVLEGRK